MSIYTLNILLLSANPKKTSQLRLAEEMRDIKEGLRLSENRDLFSISTAEAIAVLSWLQYNNHNV
ncbi:hypothetical protein NIES4075_36060 [Tolypothrix sp. NIES-4075]|nr:hypothetical protein NIES4075_36060 [Tolypothrix sp. NIES-4075]